jgi:Plasmid pRiA4b ORF-3-like protein
MPSAASPSVYQLKISLAGAAPPLWRRVQLPSEASLGFLHDVIQVAFGWAGAHLHRFEDDRGREWGDPGRESGFFGEPAADEEEAALNSVLRSERAVLWYEYDFGDSCRHRIEVEKILPLDPGVTYPRCTAGRRAASPAEDIGGLWGLEEIVYLVEHPQERPSEDFDGLVTHLRKRGWDPRAFDPGALSDQLSRMTVRTAAKGSGRKSATRRQVQRLTSDDLAFCTCGQCQAGDPVRAMGGGFLLEEVPVPAEVFPAITLPPTAELAAQARQAPVVADAFRLAEWCAGGRQVTAKGVLKPALAREAIERLQLWRRDDALAAPEVRAHVLEHLRSAGDVPALDIPWQFAVRNGLVTIRSGRAAPDADLPVGDDDLLSFWEEAFASEIDTLNELGANVMPGMLGMMGEYWDSAVFPVLQTLYRIPDGDWLDVAGLVSAFDLDVKAPDGVLAAGFVIETATRLLKVASDFGASEVDWGTVRWRGEYAAFGLIIGTVPEFPDFRARLTPLGRHGIRNLLVREGHTARLVGELATVDALTMLGEVDVFDPAHDSEFPGWVARRGQTVAVTEILAAAAGTAVDLAPLRVAAITALTFLKPDGARDVLRVAAESGPDGTRQVAASVLAGLGEEMPGFRDTVAPWLLIDLLATCVAAAAADDVGLPADVLEMIRPEADNLWRGRHPAAVDVLGAVAEAIRDSDKLLAKRLRRSAHKARNANR